MINILYIQEGISQNVRVMYECKWISPNIMVSRPSLQLSLTYGQPHPLLNKLLPPATGAINHMSSALPVQPTVNLIPSHCRFTDLHDITHRPSASEMRFHPTIPLPFIG